MCHLCVLWERCSLELLQLLQIEKKAKQRTHNVCTACPTATHNICMACTTAVHSIFMACTTVVHNICKAYSTAVQTSALHAQLQYTLHGMHKAIVHICTTYTTAVHNICMAYTTAVCLGCSHQAIQQNASSQQWSGKFQTPSILFL